MNQNQPIFILPEGYSRTIGRDAQRVNILAAKQVAETVRTTLGPKGMDKMIVDSTGNIIVTNDGVTILQEMGIEHPIAKMLVEVAKTQEDQVGDGTTTAVVLAGELLKNAEILLDKNIHPTVITKGYRLAAEYSQKIIESIAERITENDVEILKKIATTAMTGKGAETAKDLLSNLVVKAVLQILEKHDNKIIIDTDNVKLEKKTGDGIQDSELISGLVLDKERVHTDMPLRVKNARIALINSAIEIRNTETDAKIQITSPNQLQEFLYQEEKMLRDMTEKIINSGANVVFCQKGIDDIAQHYFAKKGVYACRRIKKSDMDKLAKATNAKIITNLDDLNPEDLGKAGLIESVKFDDEEMTYVRECENPKAVTILIRGSTEHVIDEVERAVKDAIGDVVASLKNGKVVGGAGAAEIEISKKLKEFSTSLSGREQLAVQSFADALEIIPKTLAENAGLDPIDMLTELKAQHEFNKWAGIDVFEGRIKDAFKSGVIEPLKIKTQAIKSASEVAELILRIDDVIAGSSRDNSPNIPQTNPDMDA
ncbi:MAG: thermosome subunit alpha [Candidatus Nanoarchaeia archaeon]|nr:thermosome subunit alpha [Candidatus Nanoarchaeia archaeon]